jgi:hypothetical protein
MKPRDRVVSAATKRLGYRTVDTWPPPWNPFHNATRNVVWPKHSFDPDNDNEHMRRIFRKAMLGRYQHGNGLVVADELYGLTVELGLNSETEALLTRGGGMGSGLMYCVQKPSGTRRGGITTFAYSSPSWMFLSRDPDKNNRERYGELECGNPKEIEDLTMNLPPYHWLCIQRDGPFFCQVGS